jgi:hypothetical protein
MSDNRKRAIRKLMAETGLKYTQAMRLHDEQRAAVPLPSAQAMDEDRNDAGHEH